MTYPGMPSQGGRMAALEARITRLERASRIPENLPVPFVTIAWASTKGTTATDLLTLRHYKTHPAITVCFYAVVDTGGVGEYSLWDYDQGVELAHTSHNSPATRVVTMSQVAYSGAQGDVRFLAVRAWLSTGGGGTIAAWALPQYAYGDAPAAQSPPTAPPPPTVPPAWPPPLNPT